MKKSGHVQFVITRHQLKAGRALAGIGVRQLSSDAGISATAISQIETGRTGQAHASTLQALRAALEQHGVEFCANGWVRHTDDTGSATTDRTGPLSAVIGANCRRIREGLQLSREHLAQAIGEKVETYADIEGGTMAPSVQTLRLIAHALGASADQLWADAPLSGDPP